MIGLHSTLILFRFGAEQPADFKALSHAVEFFFRELSSGNPGDMMPVFRLFPAPGALFGSLWLKCVEPSGACRLR